MNEEDTVSSLGDKDIDHVSGDEESSSSDDDAGSEKGTTENAENDEEPNPDVEGEGEGDGDGDGDGGNEVLEGDGKENF